MSETGLFNIRFCRSGLHKNELHKSISTILFLNSYFSQFFIMFLFQHLIRLLNILSAFPAVYEVLAEKPLPVKESYGFRHIPDTIDACLIYISEFSDFC